MKTKQIAEKAIKLASEVTDKLFILEDDNKVRITALAISLVGFAIASNKLDLPNLLILVTQLHNDFERILEEMDDD